MARFLGLILWFLTGSAWAVVPVVSDWTAESGNSSIQPGTGSTAEAACQNVISHYNAAWSPGIVSVYTGVEIYPSGTAGRCRFTQNGTPLEVNLGALGSQCPMHSVLVPNTNTCQCDPGWVEDSTHTGCQAPPDKCDTVKDMPYGGSIWASFGVMSREAMLGLGGQQKPVCPPEGCKVVGTVGGCGRDSKGRTYCSVENGKFTGVSCTPAPEEAGGDQPPEAPPATCPVGKCPGQVNGVDVCVPCHETADPPPKEPDPPASSTPPASQPPAANPPGSGPGSPGCTGNCSHTSTTTNPDGSTTTTTTNSSNSTNCTGSRCTTTTTTTTTTNRNPNGGITGGPTTSTSTSTQDQSKDDYCKQNPQAIACKGQDSQFGGACGSGFTCTGDAIQCAMARDQMRRNCQAFEAQGTQEEGAYSAAKGKTGNQNADNPNNASIDVSLFNSASPLPTGGDGVQDVSFSLMGRSVTLPFSKINSALQWIGNLILAVAWLAAYRIVTRG